MTGCLMTSYLEEDELIVGRFYECELYDAPDNIRLQYIGELFGEKWCQGPDEEYYLLDGDVRYAFCEVDGFC